MFKSVGYDFSVNEVIQKTRNKLAELKRVRHEVQTSSLSPQVTNLVMEQDQLDLQHVNILINVLLKKRQQLEGVSKLC